MIIYNTTYTLDAAIQHEWTYWVRTDYLPAILETGLVTESRVLRLISDVGQQGVVHTIQLGFSNLSTYETFSTEFVDLFYGRMAFRFGTKLASFSTVLEEV
jgi:hypothetical protein